MKRKFTKYPVNASSDTGYKEIASKRVLDYDGFYTDYTLYKNTCAGDYVCVFGDKDTYRPEDGVYDFECTRYDEAIDWFNNYEGETEDDDVYSASDLQQTQIPHIWAKYYNVATDKDLESYFGEVDNLFTADQLDGYDAKHIAWGALKDQYLTDDIYDVVEFVEEDGEVFPADIAGGRLYNVSREILDAINEDDDNVYSTSEVTTNDKDELAVQYLRELEAVGIDINDTESAIDELKYNWQFTDEEALSLLNRIRDEYVKGSEDYEDEIQEIGQEFTSENTSINSGKLPAVFNMVKFEPGTVNIDYGGGRFDNVAEYLSQYDVVNLVYDPYNRSKEHNNEVIRLVREHGGADTATCSNVLNVIKEPEVRLNVLNNIKKLVKPGGTVYITVYEGSGKGNEGPTKSGYQLNRKTADYMDEIMEVFPDATRKGKLVKAVNSSTHIQSTTYVDSQGVMGSPGDTWTDAELRQYWDSEQSNDPTLLEYDSYEDWYYDTVGQMDIDNSIKNGYVSDTEIHELILELENNGYDTTDEEDVSIGLRSEFGYDSKDVRYLSKLILNKTIQSSTAVTGSNNPYEDELNEEDEVEDYIEVTLDADIILDESGEWDYLDENYPWAMNGKDDSWYSDEYSNIRLDDVSGIVEKVDDLIETMLPIESGKYHISGDVTLVYSISGVQSDSEYYGNDEDGQPWVETEYYTDNASVDFDFNSSEVKNFKYEKLSDDVESATVITGGQLSSVKFGPPKILKGYELDEYLVASYEGVKYGVYCNTVDTDDAYEALMLFKGNVREIHPYDEGKYYWAKFDNGKIYYYSVDGKCVGSSPYMSADDWDMDLPEWFESVIAQTIEGLSELNKDVESVMVHN